MTPRTLHRNVFRWFGLVALVVGLLVPLRAAAAPPNAFLGVVNPVVVPCGTDDHTTYDLRWSSGDVNIRPDLSIKEGDAPERFIPNLTPYGGRVMNAAIGRTDHLILYTPNGHAETLATLTVTAQRNPLCPITVPAPPILVPPTRVTNFSATWEYADVTRDYTGADHSPEHTGYGGVPVVVIRFDCDETVHAVEMTLGLGAPRSNGTWAKTAKTAPPRTADRDRGRPGHFETTLYPADNQYVVFADYTPFSHPPFGLLKDDGSGDVVDFSFNDFDQVWVSINVPGSTPTPFVHKLL